MRRGDKQVKKGSKPPSRRRDRAETIRQLRASEELYRNLFENANDGIATFSLEGIVTSVNGETEHMLGWSREEIIGQPYQKFLTPASVTQSEERTRRALAREELPSIFEVELICKDGSIIPAEGRARFIRDVEGKPIGIQGIYRDITARRQAEARIKFLSEALFQANCAVIVVDIEGRIIYWNRGAEQLYGFTSAEVYGRTVEDVLQVRWLEGESAETARRALAAATGVWRGENVHTKKSGEEIYVESSVTLLRDENGTVSGVLVIIRGITERKRAEEKLQDYTERLQTLSRRLLEVQETERRTIARELHDEVGQILTGLRLNIEASLHLPADAARERLGEALTLANELIGRVHELALDLRPAMLDDMGLIPALLWRCERYTAQTQVKVNFAHTGMATRFPPEVETAAYRIVQEALTNVTLHAGVNEATVRLWTDQNQLVVEIQDQGNGFDPDAALAAGATSGLAGMRERALLLGGQFTLESAPGNGTRVTAKLPLITEQGS